MIQKKLQYNACYKLQYKANGGLEADPQRLGDFHNFSIKFKM